jgi:molybdenum cofactor cytidylyltransferase
MTGLILLAAGNSSRMGQPKQTLIYQGKTLLQHAIQAAVQSACEPVFVVLGAYADVVSAGISDESIIIIHNPEWQEGMASSIRAGIAELEKNKEIDSVIIMLCDQPFVDTGLLNSLVELQQTSSKGIVACSYHDTLGVPVLFSRAYFAVLRALEGHEGAKKILAAHPADIATIAFPRGETDIDTPDDYKRLT